MPEQTDYQVPFDQSGTSLDSSPVNLEDAPKKPKRTHRGSKKKFSGPETQPNFQRSTLWTQPPEAQQLNNFDHSWTPSGPSSMPQYSPPQHPRPHHCPSKDTPIHYPLPPVRQLPTQLSVYTPHPPTMSDDKSVAKGSFDVVHTDFNLKAMDFDPVRGFQGSPPNLRTKPQCSTSGPRSSLLAPVAVNTTLFSSRQQNSMQPIDDHYSNTALFQKLTRFLDQRLTEHNDNIEKKLRTYGESIDEKVHAYSKRIDKRLIAQCDHINNELRTQCDSLGEQFNKQGETAEDLRRLIESISNSQDNLTKDRDNFKKELNEVTNASERNKKDITAKLHTFRKDLEQGLNSTKLELKKSLENLQLEAKTNIQELVQISIEPIEKKYKATKSLIDGQLTSMEVSVGTLSKVIVEKAPVSALHAIKEDLINRLDGVKTVQEEKTSAVEKSLSGLKASHAQSVNKWNQKCNALEQKIDAEAEIWRNDKTERENQANSDAEVQVAAQAKIEEDIMAAEEVLRAMDARRAEVTKAEIEARRKMEAEFKQRIQKLESKFSISPWVLACLMLLIFVGGLIGGFGATHAVKHDAIGSRRNESRFGKQDCIQPQYEYTSTAPFTTTAWPMNATSVNVETDQPIGYPVVTVRPQLPINSDSYHDFTSRTGSNSGLSTANYKSNTSQISDADATTKLQAVIDGGHHCDNSEKGVTWYTVLYLSEIVVVGTWFVELYDAITVEIGRDSESIIEPALRRFLQILTEPLLDTVSGCPFFGLWDL